MGTKGRKSALSRKGAGKPDIFVKGKRVEAENQWIRDRGLIAWIRSFFSNPSRRDFAVILLLLCFIFLVYSNSLRNDFTNWDDQMIYDNPSIRSLDWKDIINIFTPGKASTYQPIRTLSYAVDYHFWGLSPLGYHLTSIFFYFLTCITILFSTRLLLTNILVSIPSLEGYRTAFFTSFLFAAHPVHVEAVTWLAARKEVLHGFFFFLSFYLYLKLAEIQDKKRKSVFIGLIFLTFLLSILSKPSAVVLPAIFLLYEAARRQEEIGTFLRRNWSFILVCTAISFVFISILLKVMVESEQIKPFYGGTMFSNLIIAFYLFLYNIKLVAFNTAYAAAYTITASFSLESIRTLVVIATTVLLFFFSLSARKRTSLFFFSFFWFFITLLPFLNIIPISTLLADRYAFLPSFGYCLILGFYLNKLYGLKKSSQSSGVLKGIAIFVFIGLLSGYSYLTFEQNRVWKDSFTLWTDAVRKYPEGNLANAMVGLVFLDRGEYEEASKYLEKAVRIRPGDALSHNNLGIAYTRLNRPERALEEFMESTRLGPKDDTFKRNLAIFYATQREYGKAEEVLNRLLAKNSNNANLHFQMGRLYKEMGRMDEAVAELEKSIRLAPQFIDSYEELGNIYLKAFKDPEKAIHYYTQAIKLAGKPTCKTDELRWIIQDLEGNR